MPGPDPHALRGIHHVTAIGGEPQPNVDFWVGLLGLRLVKRTVNFDDPGTWHLYYGDGAGTPGSLMTFFPWASLPPLVRARGRAGAGQVVITSLAIPHGSFDFWIDRLAGAAASFDVPEPRFGERRIALADPDGIAVELTEAAQSRRAAWWSDSPVPEAHAITGIRGVTTVVQDIGPTRDLLDALGFVAGETEDARHRFTLGDDDDTIEVVVDPTAAPGSMGIGAVHHVAWRAADDDAQAAWRERATAAGADVTPVMDRQYFRSIYFREPGGVLFEIATDPPGFTRDESLEDLGSALRLPPWLEERRPAIEARLPHIGPPRAWRL